MYSLPSMSHTRAPCPRSTKIEKSNSLSTRRNAIEVRLSASTSRYSWVRRFDLPALLSKRRIRSSRCRCWCSVRSEGRICAGAYATKGAGRSRPSAVRIVCPSSLGSAAIGVGTASTGVVIACAAETGGPALGHGCLFSSGDSGALTTQEDCVWLNRLNCSEVTRNCWLMISSWRSRSPLRLPSPAASELSPLVLQVRTVSETEDGLQLGGDIEVWIERDGTGGGRTSAVGAGLAVAAVCATVDGSSRVR